MKGFTSCSGSLQTATCGSRTVQRDHVSTGGLNIVSEQYLEYVSE